MIFKMNLGKSRMRNGTKFRNFDPGRRSHGARYKRNGCNNDKQAPVIPGATEIYIFIRTLFLSTGLRNIIACIVLFFVQLNVWVGRKYHAPLILQKSAIQGVNG